MEARRREPDTDDVTDLRVLIQEMREEISGLRREVSELRCDLGYWKSLAFCWAHVRRDFVRVGNGYPELKAWALSWLRQIRELYRLHRQRRQHDLSSSEYAQAEARLREHVAAMCQQRDAELADPKLREPCRRVRTSLKEHWSGLTVFLDDPRIPLDNNRAERLMRNPAMGRKNDYGSGAEWAGRLAMIRWLRSRLVDAR